ncbi:MAG: MarP family serine protease [Acidimicrobiales bacterium]|nr:MarP family serine protease [Acidimicrobiales bacterium]
MDSMDLIVLATAVMAAVGGYRLGFLGRVISWLGLAVGFYVAVRILPPIIVRLPGESAGTLLAIAVAVLVGGAMIGQAAGLLAGARLHGILPIGPLRQVDRAVGALVGAVGILALLWLLIPSLASVPGWPARSVSGSAISRWLSRALPPPPDALQVLRRLVGNDAPQVFSVLQPGFASGPPPATIPLTTALAGSVERSTVKVEGQACNRIYEGSGFAVGPDLIATNAHVVAGEPPGQTRVLLPSGQTRAATVVMFDPDIDIALLSVSALGEAPLEVSAAQIGQAGAVFGHPNGQDPVYASPARVAQQEEAGGRDIYDQHTTKRQVLVLAAALAHGDSGGPLVDTSGQVIGVAFAISANQPNVSYALATSELRAAMAETRAPGTSTGRCLTGS